MRNAWGDARGVPCPLREPPLATSGAPVPGAGTAPLRGRLGAHGTGAHRRCRSMPPAQSGGRRGPSAALRGIAPDTPGPAGRWGRITRPAGLSPNSRPAAVGHSWAEGCVLPSPSPSPAEQQVEGLRSRGCPRLWAGTGARCGTWPSLLLCSPSRAQPRPGAALRTRAGGAEPRAAGRARRSRCQRASLCPTAAAAAGRCAVPPR